MPRYAAPHRHVHFAVANDLADMPSDLLTDLRARLARATADVDRLKACVAPLSYEAEAGIEGADGTLAEASQELSLAERRVGKLTRPSI